MASLTPSPQCTPFPAEMGTAGTGPRPAVGDLQHDIWTALFHGHPGIFSLIIQLELKEVCEALCI